MKKVRARLECQLNKCFSYRGCAVASHHLRILKEKRIAGFKHDGKLAMYSLRDQKFYHLSNTLKSLTFPSHSLPIHGILIIERRRCFAASDFVAPRLLRRDSPYRALALFWSNAFAFSSCMTASTPAQQYLIRINAAISHKLQGSDILLATNPTNSNKLQRSSFSLVPMQQIFLSCSAAASP